MERNHEGEGLWERGVWVGLVPVLAKSCLVGGFWLQTQFRNLTMKQPKVAISQDQTCFFFVLVVFSFWNMWQREADTAVVEIFTVYLCCVVCQSTERLSALTLNNYVAERCCCYCHVHLCSVLNAGSACSAHRAHTCSHTHTLQMNKT